MSNMTISGAVSGLDTATIINQLVSVQANQQTLLKQQQTTQQSAADALGKLATALNGVGTLAGTLAKTSTWSASAVTSSSTGVTASASGTTAGALTFDVTSVAAAHALISSNAVGSTGDVVASGPLTLTASDGSTTSIDVGGGTLGEVVRAVNAAGKGVVATAVQTSPGQYRLQVAATATGQASTFSLDGLDGFTGVDVLTAGSDAAIRIGSDPATAYTITSSTNTFSDVVKGLSFTVSKLENAVTVSSAVDGTAVAGQVSKLVDAVNAVLSQISTATAWNATTKTGGPLTGDSTARSLQQRLLTMVSTAGAAGVRLTRDGTLTFDQNAFLTAFNADPDKVKAAFGATSSFAPDPSVTGQVAFSSSTSETQPGTYPIEVTARATREQWSLGAGTFGVGSIVQLSQGTTTVTYTVQNGDGATEVAAGITRAAAAAHVAVTAATDSQGKVVFTAANTGSGSAFSVDVDDNGLGSQDVAGADVEGTIDGQVATGIGDVLSLRTGTGGAVGLALDTSGVTDADIGMTGGAVGSVTYTPGLARQLATFADQATATSTGTLTSAQHGRQSEVKDLQDQIDEWDRRLTAYRASLTTQFTAMETALAALKNQTSSLAGLVGGSSASASSSSSS
jgi:flagellar hook-associated protein 2